MIISVLNRTMEIVGICRASAAAVELCKTVPAFFLCVDIAALKLVHDILTSNTLIHISHEKLFLTHKLMTRIEDLPMASRPDTLFPNRSRLSACIRKGLRSDQS